jgi:hypothetical protein
MVTLVNDSNNIIKLHFKQESKKLDLTDKLVLVSIKNVKGTINKIIETHDFPQDGITHFTLTKEDTTKIDGECFTDISIIDRKDK